MMGFVDDSEPLRDDEDDDDAQAIALFDQYVSTSL